MRRAPLIGSSAMAGLAILVALLACCCAASAATGEPGGGKVAFGAYVPDAVEHPQRLDAFARLAGRKPAIVSYYKQWDFEPFVPAELDAVWERGAVPMITWEPLSYSGKRYPLRQIQRGRFDRYIRKSARAAAQWGRPILVRFAHEMNGSWYPWGRGVEGNNSYREKAAWRRVVRIFREQGAANVEWVWTPSVNTGGKYPFRDLYPGDAWVDWVGFDGFNWALRGAWNSFTEIVDNSYEEMAQISDRPMIVAETGSSETGGDKAAWVGSALRREIPKLERIRGVVWFDERFEDEGAEGESGLDARVNSSPASLRAFRAAISTPEYGLTRAQFLATPADATGSAIAPGVPGSGFGQPSLFYRLTHKLHGRYTWYAVGIGLATLAALILAFLLVRRHLKRRGPRRKAAV